jgi:spermidine synthase
MSKRNRKPVPQSLASAPPTASSRRYFPLLLVLFFASGCSALIYEIVWYQLLQLVIGSSTVSLCVLLATFMGGLCLGSIGFSRFVKPSQHPLRIYALIELGIGICGILALLGMPLIDGIYTAAVGHGFPAMILRAVVCAVCLLPPTVLMGASLPAAARWIETNPNGVSWLGLLYGANTAGAVSGCLLAGFYLLRVYDMATATLIAALINGVVASISAVLARRTSYTATTHTGETPAHTGDTTRAWPIYATIAVSGACALGAEVVWTRLLGLLLGATVYTFSIILAVFLVGLGIGGAAAGFLLRGAIRPRLALGIAQLLLAAAVAWTAFMLSSSLPFWPVNPLLSSSPWLTFQVDMVRCIWTILPATLLWGASFPFALAAIAPRGGDPARTVGRVYAANTGGAIFGAVVFSMILIPWIGTQNAERVLIAGSAAAGLLVLATLALSSARILGLAALSVSATGAGFLIWSVNGVPGELIAYGRRIMTSSDRSKILYTGEGMNASIAISRWDDGAIQFHVSGKVEASTEPYDMRLQRMLGHMPALFHNQPRSILVVGFGAGVTAGSFTLHPEVQSIVVCEMEPLVPIIATRYFKKENHDVLNDPRTRMIYDDARHFILTSREKFDVITSDPIHPWVKGSATLYSKEYFELVKRHLNPGGVVTQWVPLYESDVATVKSELATFFEAFPNGTVWGNENGGGGYDIVLLAQADGAAIDIDTLERRLSSPEYQRVAKSLYEVGFHSTLGLLATYAGQQSDLRPWLSGAEINRDGDLRLQYLAGMAVNNSREGAIYDQILNFRVYPEGLFRGSDERKHALRSLISQPNP